jgi:hypothetical protein
MTPYYEIGKKSSITNRLFDIAMSPGEWSPYYHFGVRGVPPEVLYEDEFFIWLSRRYNFIAGILKYDPYICYDWHVDERRGVGINMLLTPQAKSFCVFNPEGQDEQVFKIKDLSYKPGTYYLFNTQVPHTVYNFESTRYLFSIEFAKDKNELSFDQLLSDIRKNYE